MFIVIIITYLKKRCMTCVQNSIRPCSDILFRITDQCKPDGHILIVIYPICVYSIKPFSVTYVFSY